MSDLDASDSTFWPCCVDEIRDWTGPEDEGVMIHCSKCARRLGVEDGRWTWKPEDTGPEYTLAGGPVGGVAMPGRDSGRWTSLPNNDGRYF